jgi:hypothetical protein
MVNTTDVLTGVTNKLFQRGLIIKNAKLDNWKKQMF